MRAIKRLLFLSIVLVLFILTSCGKYKGKPYSNIAPTSDLVFCANAMYNTKEDIPDIYLIYCCYNESFSEDVELCFLFDKTGSIYYDNNMEKLIDEEETLDKHHNTFSLYLVDESNNKLLLLDDEMYVRSCSVIEKCFDKYIVTFWSFAKQNRCSIPKEHFDSNNGEIRVSVFQKNRKSNEEQSLITIAIKYTKDENGIKIVAPEGSFSGKGLNEGKTLEEIFREA